MLITVVVISVKVGTVQISNIYAKHVTDII